MRCASLLETVRGELCKALPALRRTGVFARRAGALQLSLGRPKLYRRRWHENRRADCEIATRVGAVRSRFARPLALRCGSSALAVWNELASCLSRRRLTARPTIGCLLAGRSPAEQIELAKLRQMRLPNENGYLYKFGWLRGSRE
jgi:hypothetical protein